MANKLVKVPNIFSHQEKLIETRYYYKSFTIADIRTTESTNC